MPTYSSIPRFPAHGFRSSGRTAQLLARHQGHGTEQSTCGPKPQMLLFAYLCLVPAFSPASPQLKTQQQPQEHCEWEKKKSTRLLLVFHLVEKLEKVEKLHEKVP